VVGGQPAPFGLAGFATDRPPAGGRRDRTGAAILIVVGLVFVLLVAAVIATRAMLSDGSGTTPRAGSAAPSSSATPDGTATVPQGFRRYAHPGGFSVAVPRGWPVGRRSTGIIDLKEPGSSRFLRLIRADSGTAARTQLASAEPGFARDNSDYQRLRLEKVSYRGYDAADWEFTFSRNGTRRHVLYRAFVVDGASYAVYLSTPDDQWAASRRFFDVAVGTLDLNS
jgi:hypothetical protein